MHNLFFQTAIARFLFYVEIDEPVKPGKRNHLLVLMMALVQWRLLVLIGVRCIMRHVVRQSLTS